MNAVAISKYEIHVTVDPDEFAFLHMFIAGIDDPEVQTLPDLFVLLGVHAMAHCADELEGVVTIVDPG